MKLKVLVSILFWVTFSTWEAKAATTNSSTYDVAALLTMFVDELPRMPKLHGYSMLRGAPVPAHLTIGMFSKKWVYSF